MTDKQTIYKREINYYKIQLENALKDGWVIVTDDDEKTVLEKKGDEKE